MPLRYCEGLLYISVICGSTNLHVSEISTPGQGGRRGSGDTDQTVDVEDCESGPRPPHLQHNLHRRPILKDTIHRHNLLQHPLLNRRMIFRFIQPILVLPDIIRRARILRHKLQRRIVKQHEIPRPISIHPLKLLVHAVDVARQIRAGDLFVFEEGLGAKVVGPDPDREYC